MYNMLKTKETDDKDNNWDSENELCCFCDDKDAKINLVKPVFFYMKL